jgi:hypothetical protein
MALSAELLVTVLTGRDVEGNVHSLFEGLTWQMFGGTEGRHKNSWTRQPISRLRV